MRVNNAIEALENLDAITNHANRDFLTGLYNRRYFFKTMNPYFLKSMEEQESFIVAMVDIDHFKKINDNYGHDVGDSVIVHLSELLHTNIKEGDILARFGGEEFCMVLKDVSADRGQAILEKLCLKVERSPFILDDEKELCFTISIGATSQLEETLEDTINQADMLLYNAKHSGRNRVVFS